MSKRYRYTWNLSLKHLQNNWNGEFDREEQFGVEQLTLECAFYGKMPLVTQDEV